MTNTTYNVRIWKTEQYKGKKKTTYYVRWKVEKQSFKQSFMTKALADSFRSKLVAATSDGTAFDRESGLPVTMLRTNDGDVNWLDFARDYVDMKWRTSSPKHRKSIADSLVPITEAMLSRPPNTNDRKKLRKALRVAFNPNLRETHSVSMLSWAHTHCRNVSALSDPSTLRSILTELDYKVDGERASANTVRLRRTTLTNSLDFAVERDLLPKNPMHDIKTAKAKTSLGQVDGRSVPNPRQARSLLKAVSETHPYLEAFFAVMYFAALRPEEATNLRKQDLSLPDTGWGYLYLEQASPEVGQAWTDSRTREQRNLKHREDGAVRPVPSPPELTTFLNHHIATYGTAADGRLFRGKRSGGRVGSSVYGRVWAQARETALANEDSTNTLLAKRPYDLRHAAVSTWLNAGVEPARVAEWAGHSVSVLLRVYAKCLDGGEKAAQERIEWALNMYN